MYCNLRLSEQNEREQKENSLRKIGVHPEKLNGCLTCDSDLIQQKMFMFRFFLLFFFYYFVLLKFIFHYENCMHCIFVVFRILFFIHCSCYIFIFNSLINYVLSTKRKTVISSACISVVCRYFISKVFELGLNIV